MASDDSYREVISETESDLYKRIIKHIDHILLFDAI